MKTILSVDFDIIMEPSIQFYNGMVPQLHWDIITKDNAYGNLLIGDYNTYAKITDYLLKLTKKLPKEKIHFIQTHETINKFLDKNEKYNVINIDHHHDRGYNDRVNPIKNQELNCSNWVNFIQNLTDYYWICNENSEILTDEVGYIRRTNIKDCDLNKLPTPDELFICFSMPWIPPNNQPLFYSWLDIFNAIYNTRFEFEEENLRG